MSKHDPSVGDTFEVYIDRESGSGNLLAAHDARVHVLPTDDHDPAPRQRWRVEVQSVGGTVDCHPIERVDEKLVTDDDPDLGNRNDMLGGRKL
jgi:hypothetical protein